MRKQSTGRDRESIETSFDTIFELLLTLNTSSESSSSARPSPLDLELLCSLRTTAYDSSHSTSVECHPRNSSHHHVNRLGQVSSPLPPCSSSPAHSRIARPSSATGALAYAVDRAATETSTEPEDEHQLSSKMRALSLPPVVLEPTSIPTSDVSCRAFSTSRRSDRAHSHRLERRSQIDRVRCATLSIFSEGLRP